MKALCEPTDSFAGTSFLTYKLVRLSGTILVLAVKRVHMSDDWMVVPPKKTKVVDLLLQTGEVVTVKTHLLINRKAIDVVRG